MIKRWLHNLAWEYHAWRERAARLGIKDNAEKLAAYHESMCSYHGARMYK